MLRIRQWIKNLFVFLPLIFGGGLLVPSKLLAAAEVFVCFCLLSSAVYIFNDIGDREADRLHPLKRSRPIASGRVTPGQAWTVCILLAAVSLAPSFLLFGGNLSVFGFLAAYLVLNILYSWRLKHMAIIDVMVISTGFVLRVFAGGAACGIAVSPWLAVMTFLLALFIAFGKRRDDLLRSADGEGLRRSVSAYTIRFVDTAMSVLSAALIIAYIIYTLSPEVMQRFHSRYVYVTTIFVIAGVLRYMQLAIVKKSTGQPDELLRRDPFLLACVAMWLASFLIIIYL